MSPNIQPQLYYEEYPSLSENSYIYPEQSYLLSQEPLCNQRYKGRLKFFDQSGHYGFNIFLFRFIVIDGMNCDLFVHYDDLIKTGIAKEKLANLKNNY